MPKKPKAAASKSSLPAAAPPCRAWSPHDAPARPQRPINPVPSLGSTSSIAQMPGGVPGHSPLVTPEPKMPDSLPPASWRTTTPPSGRRSKTSCPPRNKRSWRTTFYEQTDSLWGNRRCPRQWLARAHVRHRRPQARLPRPRLFPEKETPSGQVADKEICRLRRPRCRRRCPGVDVVTFEFENVLSETVEPSSATPKSTPPDASSTPPRTASAKKAFCNP